MSAHDQPIIDSFEGFDVALPTGRVIRCRPLVVSQFVHFYALLRRFTDHSDSEAYIDLITTFPEAIGYAGLVEELMPGEVMHLLQRFFILARPFPGATTCSQCGQSLPTNHVLRSTGDSPTSGLTSPGGMGAHPTPATVGQ